MADDQDPFSYAAPLDDSVLNDENMRLGLRGLISPVPAQSLPPPNTPPRSGPAESTPLTGTLATAPTQAQPKVSGPAMIPGMAARPESLKAQQAQRVMAYAQRYPGASASAPAMPSGVGASATQPALAAAAQPSVAPDRLNMQTQQAQDRLTQLQNAKSGGAQIQRPWLRDLARIGDIAGSVLAPGVTQWIPGSTLNHQRELGNQEAVVGSDQRQQQARANLADTASQTAQRQADAPRAITPQEATAMGDPTLAGQMWTPRAIAAYTGTNSKNQTSLKKQEGVIQSQAAKNGQTVTFDGQGTPTFKDDPNSQVFQARQAVNDLHKSEQSLAQARADVAAAGNDPTSPAYQLAVKKLQTASSGHDAAMVRAQAQLINAYGGYHGTDTSGNPLPGAPLTDSDQPVGSHFATGVLPTGQMRGRGQLSQSAYQQATDMLSILKNKPDLFGPASGRYTSMTQWLGSQDPDAQRFKAAETNLEDHMAGTFGARSEAVIRSLHDVYGKNETNPAAATAALHQALGAIKLFERTGTPRTVGSNAAQPGGLNPPNPAPQLTPQQRIWIRPGKGQQLPKQGAAAYVAANGSKQAGIAAARRDGWDISKPSGGR